MPIPSRCTDACRLTDAILEDRAKAMVVGVFGEGIERKRRRGKLTSEAERANGGRVTRGSRRARSHSPAAHSSFWRFVAPRTKTVFFLQKQSCRPSRPAGPPPGRRRPWLGELLGRVFFGEGGERDFFFVRSPRGARALGGAASARSPTACFFFWCARAFHRHRTARPPLGRGLARGRAPFCRADGREQAGSEWRAALLPLYCRLPAPLSCAAPTSARSLPRGAASRQAHWPGAHPSPHHAHCVLVIADLRLTCVRAVGGVV
jgi:hypothetical protein